MYPKTPFGKRILLGRTPQPPLGTKRGQLPVDSWISGVPYLRKRLYGTKSEIQRISKPFFVGRRTLIVALTESSECIPREKKGLASSLTSIGTPGPFSPPPKFGRAFVGDFIGRLSMILVDQSVGAYPKKPNPRACNHPLSGPFFLCLGHIGAVQAAPGRCRMLGQFPKSGKGLGCQDR